MVSFELNGKKYSSPKGWENITFEKFLKYLSDIAPKTPEILKELFESENLAETWNGYTDKYKLICYDFFALSVGFWCGLPAEEIKESMNIEQLESAFFTIEIDLANMQNDDTFTGFEIKGKRYVLPAENMEGSTVSEFAEASQFQENFSEVEGGEWLSMLDVMVVLCRPEGEKYSYDKNTHNLRKKLFKKLSMDKVINTAFFLLRLNVELKNNLLIYSMLQEIAVKQEKQLKKLTVGI